MCWLLSFGIISSVFPLCSTNYMLNVIQRIRQIHIPAQSPVVYPFLSCCSVVFMSFIISFWYYHRTLDTNIAIDVEEGGITLVVRTQC